MKLSTLLAQHQKNQKAPGSLELSFGDGYLCSYNRIFSKIRKQALEVQFQFSCDFNKFYLALPLSQLDAILESKTIPYLDNVSVLKVLEEKIPSQTVWDDISDNLKGNSVFHESCHAFAHAHLTGLDPVLQMMVEESYANACEFLSIIDAEDQVHRIFLELSSYVYMLDSRVHLRQAEQAIGLSSLLRFMLLCYLHSNFLESSIDFERVFRLSTTQSLDLKTQKNLRQLSKIAFELNPRFREVTTRFHFKLHGLKPVPGFDFLSEIERSPKVLDFLNLV